jgi:hypothetical protein
LKALGMICLNSGLLPGFEEALEAFVLETLNEGVKRNPLRYAWQACCSISSQLTGDKK